MLVEVKKIGLEGVPVKVSLLLIVSVEVAFTFIVLPALVLLRL